MVTPLSKYDEAGNGSRAGVMLQRVQPDWPKDRTMKQESDGIRAVIFQDGDLWVAQCLEYDIGAQAHDLDTVRRRLGLAIEIEQRTSMEIHGREFAGIDRAPARFFEMWEKRLRAFGTKSEIQKIGQSFALDLALYA
jgi:hypothetical protein